MASAPPPDERSNRELVTHVLEILHAHRHGIDSAARPQERLAARASATIGTGWFVAVHGVMIAAWIMANLALGAAALDPAPFSYLGLILTAESLAVAIIFITNQNRESRFADARANLDIVVNVLAEREITRLLRAIDHVAEKLGVETAEPSDSRQDVDLQVTLDAIREAELRASERRRSGA